MLYGFGPARGFTGHAAEQTIKLKYSNFLPATHPFTTLGQQFCDEIKKRTNGKVEITYYPGGILTTATKVYDGVVNGVSDIGLSHIGYTRGVSLSRRYLTARSAMRAATWPPR